MSYSVHIVNGLGRYTEELVCQYIYEIWNKFGTGVPISYMEPIKIHSYLISSMYRIQNVVSWNNLYHIEDGYLLVMFCQSRKQPWWNCPHSWVFSRYKAFVLTYPESKTLCAFYPEKNGSLCSTHGKTFSECHKKHFGQDGGYGDVDGVLDRRKGVPWDVKFV